MTPTPLLLALALASSADAAPATGAAAYVDAVERLPLPRAEGAVSVRVDAFEARIVIEATRTGPAFVQAIRSLSRLVCPEVEELPRGVVLRCRSTRIEAALRPGPSLEVRELAGLPWSGAVAMPVLFHEPAALGLGSCREGERAAEAECALRDGRRDDAESGFIAAAAAAAPGAGRDHARLRVGDLALLRGDVEGAERWWARVEAEPWARLAAARRCELSAACIVAKGEKLYDGAGLPVSFQRELRLRAARTRAFRREALAAAWSLAGEWDGAGACAGGQPLCRRIVLAALRDPAGRPEEALALHAAGIRSDQGAFALELADAAASVAARLGAPGFAAASLASAAGRVSSAALPEHLLRTAELYAQAGDAIRARVLLDFARARLGERALRGARWRAVAKATASPRRDGALAAGEAPARDVPELTRARAALARAQTTPGAEP